MNFTVTTTEQRQAGMEEHHHGVRTLANAMAEFDLISQVIDLDIARYGTSCYLVVTVTNRKGEILASKGAS